MKSTVKSCCMFTLLVVASAALQVRVTAGPVLEVEPSEFDFGRQQTNNTEYPFSFMLWNTGDETLVIEEVRAGCGCTKVELAEKRLEPGTEQKLTGVFQTRGFEGPTRKTIVLRTNEAEGRRHILRLSIVLPFSQTGLRFAPRNMRWFWARPFQDTFRAVVSLENCNAEGDLQVLEMELPEGWTCNTRLPLVVRPESRATLILTRPLGDGEPFDDQDFAVKTNCTEAPEMRAALRYYQPRQAAAAASKSSGQEAQAQGEEQ